RVRALAVEQRDLGDAGLRDLDADLDPVATRFRLGHFLQPHVSISVRSPGFHVGRHPGPNGRMITPRHESPITHGNLDWDLRVQLPGMERELLSREAAGRANAAVL